MFIGYAIALIREINPTNIRRIINLFRLDPSGRALWRSLKSALFNIYQANTLPRWRPNFVIDESHNPHSPPQVRELAYVIHIHFPEYLERTRNLIKVISSEMPNVDFYITTTNSDIFEDLKLFKSAVPAIRDVQLSVNKGRNFAPILISYSQILKEYEFVVHLHSKKSTHAKSKKAQLWANMFWFTLGESNTHLNSFLAIMRADPSIAVGYPISRSLHPPKAYSWGLNGPSVRQAAYFCRDLANSQDDERFAFPAGGMLIFRPRYFTELLNFPWSIEDFPDEVGQLDGTLQHVIERLFGFIPKRDSLKQLTYLMETDEFSVDTSFADFDLGEQRRSL